jgi:hypothetical protein
MIPVESALNGSTDGLPIPVVATATAGTLIHTCGSSGFEKVWIFAANVTALVVRLTVEWGSVSDPGGHLVHSMSILPYSPPIPIAIGQVLQNGKVVRAFCSTASGINITGFAISVQ